MLSLWGKMSAYWDSKLFDIEWYCPNNIFTTFIYHFFLTSNWSSIFSLQCIFIISAANFIWLCSFEYLERESKSRRFIDVWPLCVWQNESFDTTFLLLLQLACVLHMKHGKSKAELRIFIVVESKHNTYYEFKLMYAFSWCGHAAPTTTFFVDSCKTC